MGKQYITPEKDLVRSVLEVFSGDNPSSDCEVRLWRRNVLATEYVGKDGKRRYVRAGETGQSDLWGICTSVCPLCHTVRRGVHIEIECKNETNKPTVAQALWINQILKLGGIAFVLRPDKKVGLLKLKQRVLREVHCVCPSCKEKAGGKQEAAENIGKVKLTSVEEYKRLLIDQTLKRR